MKSARRSNQINLGTNRPAPAKGKRLCSSRSARLSTGRPRVPLRSLCPKFLFLTSYSLHTPGKVGPNPAPPWATPETSLHPAFSVGLCSRHNPAANSSHLYVLRDNRRPCPARSTANLLTSASPERRCCEVIDPPFPPEMPVTATCRREAQPLSFRFNNVCVGGVTRHMLWAYPEPHNEILPFSLLI